MEQDLNRELDRIDHHHYNDEPDWFDPETHWSSDEFICWLIVTNQAPATEEALVLRYPARLHRAA